MPIPNDFSIKKEETKIYPPLPKNIYQTELLALDLVDAKGKYAKEGDKNFQFQFTILEGRDKDEDLRGRNVWNNFVPTSLYIGKNGKNVLYQIVEAFIGRELTPAEEATGLSGAMLNKFIGRQIKIFIDHRVKDGKTYNNITSYMPAETLLPALTAEERENARVKVKKEEPKEQEPQGDYPVDSHIEDPGVPVEESEFDVEDLPF